MSSSLRDEIARALYEHWVAECVEDDWAGWERLGDKQSWLDRADAVLAIPEIAEALGMGDVEKLNRIGHSTTNRQEPISTHSEDTAG